MFYKKALFPLSVEKTKEACGPLLERRPGNYVEFSW
jgi:hypothetical protein